MLLDSKNNSYGQKTLTGFVYESHPFKLYLLSLIIGIVSTFATIGFIKFYLLLRKWIYLSKSISLIVIYQHLPLWGSLAIFIVGGALLGLFIYYIIPFHGYGHGLINFLHAFKRQKPISLVEGLGSTAASSFSLGLGASVGREAPVMFLAGAIASWFCQLFNFKGHYYRILLAAAVATALATSLHSSFMAIFFILEVVAFSLKAIDLIPIALAVFAGALIRLFLPDLLPPAFWIYPIEASANHILFYLVLGILLAFFAMIFTQSLKYTLSWHLKSKLPNWIWPIGGGIALGIIAHYCPAALGLGFDFIKEAESWTTLSLKLIGLLLLFKFLATYFSLGFGFSGGVITPAFILGLLSGLLYCIGLKTLFPVIHFQFPTYAIAAAAIFTSLIIGGPLTMTLLSFEITHDITLSLNIFVGILVANLILRIFKVKSCYHTQYSLLFKKESMS